MSNKKGPALALVLFCLAGLLFAQRGGGLRFSGHDTGPAIHLPDKGEFHFIRVEYTDIPQRSRGFGFGSRNGTGNGWWLVDWPDADEHFSTGLGRLTRIEVAAPLHFRLTDSRLFENPWIYATQTGWWNLSKAETDQLREYLLRGGFLVTDDFWSSDADSWPTFAESMTRAAPGRPIETLAESDLVMHVVYDIKDKDRTFIPGTRHLRIGPGGTVVIQQPPGTSPEWKAIYDEKGHMIVAVNYNTDVGDAWEYADSPEYPEPMTELAYHYGINYVAYSMTH